MTSGIFGEMIPVLHWFSDFLIPVTKEPDTVTGWFGPNFVWLFKDSCTPFVPFLNHWGIIEIHVHWLHYSLYLPTEINNWFETIHFYQYPWQIIETNKSKERSTIKLSYLLLLRFKGFSWHSWVDYSVLAFTTNL